MIAKIRKGAGLGALLRYVYREDKHPEVIAATCAGTKREAVDRELSALIAERSRIKRPVFHCALSLPPGEQLGRREWAEVVHKFMRGMGFDGAPFVAVAHHDTEHPHVHIVASRVRRDRSLVSDSYDFPRAELLMRQFERDFELREVPCSWEVEGKSPTQEQYHHARRAPQKDAREHLLAGVMAALEEKDLLRFERTLNAKQITRAWRTDEKTGQIRGVSFCFQGVQLSGSTLSKPCSWPRIARTMGLERHLSPSSYDERLRDARLSAQLTPSRRARLRQRLHARAHDTSTLSPRDERPNTREERGSAAHVQDAPVARTAQVREEAQGVRSPDAVESPRREVAIHDMSHMSLEAYTTQYTRDHPESPMVPSLHSQGVSGQVAWSDVLCREGRFTPVREASGVITLVPYEVSLEAHRGAQVSLPPRERAQVGPATPPPPERPTTREVVLYDESHRGVEAYTAQYTREKPQSPMTPLRQNQEVSGQVGWSDVLCKEGRFTPVREASGAIRLVPYDARFEAWRGARARLVRSFGRAVHVEAAPPRPEVHLVERPNRTLAEHMELAKTHAPQHSFRALGEGDRVRGTLLTQDLLMKDGRFTLIQTSSNRFTIAPYHPSFEDHRGAQVNLSRSRDGLIRCRLDREMELER